MSQFEDLFVNRVSDTGDFMKTMKQLDVVVPSVQYLYDGDTISKVTDEAINEVFNEFSCEIVGEWISQDPASDDPTNILGGIGKFLTPLQTINIPVLEGTEENYKMYGCSIVNKGETFQIDSQGVMPLFEMEISYDYGKTFILSEKFANGMYLEYHNMPHLYYKKEDNASGYLILGKKITSNKYALSAIRIPCKTLIYIPPFVIHNDCFLIGKYCVAYNKSSDFSTVRMLTQKDGLTFFTGVNFI